MNAPRRLEAGGLPLMKEPASYRAAIPPVPEGGQRPVWSVMIPTYNCAGYLLETLGSVLAQDMGPAIMQIEVIDDCSTLDDPAAVVAEVGRGRVGFHRQPRNMGHIANFDTCLKRARGRIVHLLHGDDCVLAGFYRKMQRAFEERADIGAAFCRHIFMDESGHWLSISPLEQPESGVLDDWLARLASEQRIMTPSIAVRREAYERLGGFDRRLVCSEDWEMWVRIAACYPIWYEAEPLALYRMHLNSNTGRHMRTGEDIRYTREAIDIFKAYLPTAIAHDATRRAKETYALAALRAAEQMLAKQDKEAMAAQLREALRLSRSPKVVRRTMRLLVNGGGSGGLGALLALRRSGRPSS